MKLISEQEAAEMLGCSVHKMQRDRQIGSPIPFVKIGKSVKYRHNQVIKYIESQTYTNTSQYDGGCNE